MRFGRSRDGIGRGPSVERLVGRTRNRLAIFTLLLVIALVSAAGLVTAAAAVRAMEGSVDRTLRESAAAVMANLIPEPVSAPGPSPGTSVEPEGSPEDSGEPNEDAGEGSVPTQRATHPTAPPETAGPVVATPAPSTPRHRPPAGGDGRTPEPGNGTPRETPEPGAEATDQPGDGSVVVRAAIAIVRSASATGSVAPAPSPDASAAPSRPAASASPAAGALLETDEHVPSSADTFFLVLDPQGNLKANPQSVTLGGLPDAAAVEAARQNGEDLRTTTVDGAPVRLLTQPIVDAAGVTRGFLQSALVLTLLRSQEADLWQTVLLVTVIAVFGAAAVTLLVTHRALTPVRRAFATERRFVAAASHELRTPVAVIRASAEILGREGLVLPEGERFVADVVAESDRLTRLIADLLALSSIQAGAMSLHAASVDLGPFLDRVAGRASSLAAAHAVTVVVEPGDGPPSIVEVDPERLEQLLMIFLDNAVDHSPPNGTVRLSLQRVPARGAVVLSVIDQGPGVPPRERKRVFEPFARLPGWRRNASGTGLGLSVARALADRLGAVIAVGDAPGGGAAFTVTLRSRPNTQLRHSDRESTVAV